MNTNIYLKQIICISIFNTQTDNFDCVSNCIISINLIRIEKYIEFVFMMNLFNNLIKIDFTLKIFYANIFKDEMLN